MKTLLLFVSFLFCLSGYSQNTSKSDVAPATVLKKYIEATTAGSRLDSISSITTKYKGQTPMGEIVIEKTTSEAQIIEKWSLSGNVLFQVVASKDECYQLTNGEKKILPASMCNDFKSIIGLMPEINLLNNDKIDLKEIEINGEKFYSVAIPGETASQNFIYSQATGLKTQEIQITTTGDKVAENITTYKEYTSHGDIKFPSVQTMSNFMQSGIDVDFKLEDVQFNIPSNSK